MSLNISINLPDGDVSALMLDIHLQALGFSRAGAVSTPTLAAAAPAVAAEAPAEAGRRTTRKKADEAKPAISTNPEDRKPPEDDEATQAQDAADEKAEVDADRKDETPLTVDDVRASLGLYVNKHGMPATQQDGIKIFEAVLGKPPEGEAAWKLTLLADMSQEKLKAVIDAFTKAAASDKRFGA